LIIVIVVNEWSSPRVADCKGI